MALESVNEHEQMAGSRRKQGWVFTGTAGWWVGVWEGTHSRPFKSVLKIQQYFYKQ